MRKILVPLAAVFALLSCQPKPQIKTDLAQNAIIPKPVSVTATGTAFIIMDDTSIYIQGDGEDLKKTAQYLHEMLQPATGFDLQIQSANAAPSEGIYLSLGDDKELGKEGYKLNITENLVTLTANDAAGLFYGIQTLRQLLPASIEGSTKQTGPWYLPTGTIRDYPEYGYRGAMLDMSRHFLGFDAVEHLMDMMALYKLNTLHLHLTDDDGWRIQIDSWPKLTSVGGKTDRDGKDGGGYFTKEQYKELQQYAADRHILIIPEVEMPGHLNSALTSYPELNCEVTNPKSGRKQKALCFDEQTYKFLDDVFGELAEITDGPYIHIGGDEASNTKMEDYIPFEERVQQIVYNHHKTVIGWDEIADVKLDKRTIVQYWGSAENAQNAVEQGNKIIMSPGAKTYMDMKYDSLTKLGLDWAGYIEAKTAYDWDPTTVQEGIGRENIIGVEPPLWTETIRSVDDMEYMMFPRLTGYAEISWTPMDQRNWEEYKHRLATQGKRYKELGINFYASKQVPWEEADEPTKP